MEIFQLRTNLIFYVEADAGREREGGVCSEYFIRAKLLLLLLASAVDSYKEVWVYALPGYSIILKATDCYVSVAQA